MKPIFLVGEAQGENEAKIGKGFVGTSGIELLRMLNQAKVITLTVSDYDYLRKYYDRGDPRCIDAIWQMHPELYRTNVFQLHPPGNDLKYLCGTKHEGIPGYPGLLPSKYVRKEYAKELERLGDEIIDHDPNLIVCLGNSALWALTGRTGITKLRGTTLVSTHVATGYKLLPTYHPSAVTRQYELRPTTIFDLSKINREKNFPEIRRPKGEIWIEPDLDDIRRFIDQHIRGCSILSVDIETVGNQVTCIGFAPQANLAIVIPIFDDRRATRCYWDTPELERLCWELIREVLTDVTIKKVFQNGVYDIAFLLRSVGIKVFGALHDTMLCHHALQPEALKGLAFLGSVYTDHGPWKVERGWTGTIKRDE